MAPSPPTEAELLQSYLLHPSPLSTILPYTAFQALIPASSRQNPSLKRLYRELQFQRDITIDDVRRHVEEECRRSTTLTAHLARQIHREENERAREQSSRERERNRNKLKRKRDGERREFGCSTHRHTQGRSSGTDNGVNGDQDGDQNGKPFDSHGDEHDNHDVGSGSDADEHTDGCGPAEVDIDRNLHGPLGSTLPSKSQNNHTTDSLLKAMRMAKEDLLSEIAALEEQVDTVHKDCEDRVGGLSDLRYGRFTQNRISTESASGETSIENEVVGALEELRARLQSAEGQG